MFIEKIGRTGIGDDSYIKWITPSSGQTFEYGDDFHYEVEVYSKKQSLYIQIGKDAHYPESGVVNTLTGSWKMGPGDNQITDVILWSRDQAEYTLITRNDSPVFHVEKCPRGSCYSEKGGAWGGGWPRDCCPVGSGQCRGEDFYRCVDTGTWDFEPENDVCSDGGNGGNGGCNEGQTKCEGTDLYECVDGIWQLMESNSTDCGYVPPNGDNGETQAIPIVLGVATLTIVAYFVMR